jgi:Reverse transcriptase (RNA-dependent DNA polymerase)
MKEVGFRPLMSESCVFVNEDKSVWIMVYVDDIAIAAWSKAEIDRVAHQLGSKFMLTEIGEVKTFLGLRLIRDRKLRTVQISQGPYIERVLGRKSWTNLNGVGSPLDNRMKYDSDLPELEGQDRVEFLELVGSAQWISNNTRPDVTYAANFLGRHRQHPT